MLPTKSHAPTNIDLIELRKDAARVDQQIDRHKLFECRTHRLHKIVELCSLIREAADSLCREIDDQLAGVPEIIPMTPNYMDPFDLGLLYISPEPWLDESEAEHPANCSCPGCIDRALREGQYEVATLAMANSSLDRRPA